MGSKRARSLPVAGESGGNLTEEVAFNLKQSQVGSHLAELKERTFHMEERAYAKAGRGEMC